MTIRTLNSEKLLKRRTGFFTKVILRRKQELLTKNMGQMIDSCGHERDTADV